MKTASETLPNETHVLHKMVLDYQSTVDQLQEKLTWYEEQFRLLVFNLNMLNDFDLSRNDF
jgi:hypothetical protein